MKIFASYTSFGFYSTRGTQSHCSSIEFLAGNGWPGNLIFSIYEIASHSQKFVRARLDQSSIRTEESESDVACKNFRPKRAGLCQLEAPPPSPTRSYSDRRRLKTFLLTEKFLKIPLPPEKTV